MGRSNSPIVSKKLQTFGIDNLLICQIISVFAYLNFILIGFFSDHFIQWFANHRL
jgi:hypothetical protein